MAYIINVNRKTNSYTLRRTVRKITVNRVGKHGKAGTVQVGSTTTLPAGSDATVANSGTDTAAILDFGIPQGAKGDPGDPATNLVTSVNGRVGAVTGLAEKAELDMVEEELYQDLTQGDAATLLAANQYTDEQISSIPPVDYPVTSVNGRTGAVTGLAEQALLDMVEEELYEDLTAGDAATLASAKSYTDEKVDYISFPVISVNDKIGIVTLYKSDIGLGNVDNTSDINKPVSTATQTALNAKRDLSNPGLNSLYSVTAAGVQSTLRYAETIINLSIPMRDAAGRLQASAAVNPNELVPLSQLNTSLGNYVLKSGDTSTGVQRFDAGIISTTAVISDTNGVHTANNTRLLRLSGGMIDNGAVILLGGPTSSVPNLGLFRIGASNVGGWGVNGMLLGGNIANSAPTHSLTLPSTATGIALYNTTDQVTNYERLLINSASGIHSISTQSAGTGVARPIRITGTAAAFQYLAVNPGVGSGGLVNIMATNSTPGALAQLINGTWNASSSIQYGLGISPTINQSSIAGYTALLINPTHTSVGSGSKLLTDWQVGGTSLVRLQSDGVFLPVQATTAGAPAYIKGGVYFDTTLNKLRIGGATAWETVTSA